MDSDFDTIVSPSDASQFAFVGTCSTPDTELSAPDSTALKESSPRKERLWAKEKSAQLLQGEKVSSLP